MKDRFHTSNWRKTAISIYKAPSDGKIFGTYEVDATEMLHYIEMKKKQGKRITVTNLVTAALARALFYDVPEVNCFVRRGKLVQRDHVDVFISVAQKGKNITGVIIKHAETYTVEEIASYQQSKLEKTYTGKKDSFKIKDSIGKIPWPLRGIIVKFIKWWLFDMGLRLPFIKLSKDPFGSIALSNIGVFGLTAGYMALFPIANIPAAFSMGAITEKPTVINGEITIRPFLPISGTFDHRIMEADKIGILKDGVERRLLQPTLLDKPEE